MAKIQVEIGPWQKRSRDAAYDRVAERIDGMAAVIDPKASMGLRAELVGANIALADLRAELLRWKDEEVE